MDTINPLCNYITTTQGQSYYWGLWSEEVALVWA